MSEGEATSGDRGMEERLGRARPPWTRIWKRLHMLARPEYLYRPWQLGRRSKRLQLWKEDKVRLAWELPISVDPGSNVGQAVLNLAVFDRVVPEMVLRLTDPGEECLDVGANCGMITSVMALAAGEGGRVHAFEPGTKSWELLSSSRRKWDDYALAERR